MTNQSHVNAYQKSAKAAGYSQTPTPGSPTYTEAWALIEAARRMADSITQYTNTEETLPKAREILRKPLRLNWRLWTIFQAELINGMDDPNNAMPADLRTNMLTLCQFVDKHTTETLADPSPEKIAVLIDLNRNIASGHLENAGTAGDDAASAPQTPGQAPYPSPSPQSASADQDEPAAPPLTGFSEDV